MKIFLSISAVLFVMISAYCQDFTYNEYNNWKRLNYPDAVINMLDEENFLFEHKRYIMDEGSAARDEKRFYYSYIKGTSSLDWPFFNITCHVTIDRNYSDNMPRGQQCIQFQFYSRVRKSNDLLIGKIKDYFDEDWYWLSSNGTKFDIYSSEDDGIMQYVLNIWYPVDN